MNTPTPLKVEGRESGLAPRKLLAPGEEQHVTYINDRVTWPGWAFCRTSSTSALSERK